jgi:hypothetical protein
VGKRSRNRARAGGAGGAGGQAIDTAPTGDYSDPDGNVLTLRGSLTAASRSRYHAVVTGGLDREDAWQKAVEFLFERLAVSWTIAGVPIESQKELLARYRVASPQERRFVRDSIRTHVSEHFPELQAP